MFQLAKNGTVVRLLRFSPLPMFACAATYRASLAFLTTIIEDTHLTLICIPFKVEVNNSLLFLPLQTYEKKFAEFPFLFIYNSLVCVTTTAWSCTPTRCMGVQFHNFCGCVQGIINMNRKGNFWIHVSTRCQSSS